MKFLLEAHHPADIHLFKFPIRELQKRGHTVKMIARDRDVMTRLLNAYPWIQAEIPVRRKNGNRFPLLEMLQRQWIVARSIQKFQPNLVVSSMGSYVQSSALMGTPSVVFNDSEFHWFNHLISNPFATEIHTPYCFYKDFGSKQRTYQGIHEMAFTSPKYFSPDPTILSEHPGLEKSGYVLIRTCAWNTLHDINQSGMGDQVERFIAHFKDRFQIVLCAEENRIPEHLREFVMQVAPEHYHDLIYYARFVLTEGASTASEAACLGVPSVYINSNEICGYLRMLEQKYGIIRGFNDAKPGVDAAIEWLESIDDNELDGFKQTRNRVFEDHTDVVAHVVETLERMGGG